MSSACHTYPNRVIRKPLLAPRAKLYAIVKSRVTLTGYFQKHTLLHQYCITFSACPFLYLLRSRRCFFHALKSALFEGDTRHILLVDIYCCCCLFLCLFPSTHSRVFFMTGKSVAWARVSRDRSWGSGVLGPTHAPRVSITGPGARAGCVRHGKPRAQREATGRGFGWHSGVKWLKKEQSSSSVRKLKVE